MEQVKVICGPLLRYIEVNYERRSWRGSCLLVLNSKEAPSLPLLLAADESQSQIMMSPAKVECIDIYRHEYYFWRYELILPLLCEPQTVQYSSDCLPSKVFEFHLPAIQDSMRFMFYSCGGFSNVPRSLKERYNEKGAPLWQDVLDRHNNNMPLHVMLGGGDQLYQDSLIFHDFMKPWVAEKNPKKRLAMKLGKNMKDGFEEFFFWNYISNFGFEGSPVQAQAYASIPSVNMWDDHDIIDGYGSYPNDLQSCDCFQVLFANATRFYYSFQQHTNLARAEKDGMIPGKLSTCNHILTTLGPDIGFLSLDARGERTKYQICSKESYDRLFQEMELRLPTTIKHFVVLTGVPVIYPRLTFFEKAMDRAANLHLAQLTAKAGVLGDLINEQLNNEWNGDPELLDDMNDHWTAIHHEVERKQFIQRLQAFARDQSVRVSFLGGDVHCCAAGKLFSKDMRDAEESDPNLMVQLVSSAIVNIPPPSILLSYLNQSSGVIPFEGDVQEEMYDLFHFSPNGNQRHNKKLMGMRNYSVGYFDDSTSSLVHWLQVEEKVGIVGTKGYQVEVPKLIYGLAGNELHSGNAKKHLLVQSSSLISLSSRTTPDRFRKLYLLGKKLVGLSSFWNCLR